MGQRMSAQGSGMTLTPDPESKKSQRRSRKRLRAALMDAQRGLCAYCDEEMTILAGPRLATLDHVIPMRIGGGDVESNIVLACWQCNRAKGCMTVEQLRRLADRIALFTGAPVFIHDEPYRYIPKTRVA